ncbi:MAG: DUF1343 domain-containing protein [Puniceicoccales bacterium]|jgi:uncharacterized protein YbbC (DUF1343 family)|nr:DUF1343 domain-containing protein [Puniceicoccales bacterium]
MKPVLWGLVLCLGLMNDVLGAKVWLGIDVLEKEMGFRPLMGKRVGLLTHDAAVNSEGQRTLDVLAGAKNVRLTTLFCPEHGLDGKTMANEFVAHGWDEKTKRPIFSLHGKYRAPTPEMLEGIDILVVDLQDIGVRSYTYISCMRYAVESCLRVGIDVLILDRPNPLGGNKVSGPFMDEDRKSYVGAFNIPYVHGLTMGELGRMVLDEKGSHRKARLDVVSMKGWRRSMRWHETGLKWVKTSPNIPDLAAVLGYTATGVGCLCGSLKNGAGGPHPFRLLSCASLTDLPGLYARLRAYRIPGVRFQWIDTKEVQGIYVVVDRWDLFDPGELTLRLLQTGIDLGHSSSKIPSIDEMMAHILGENELIRALSQKGSAIDVPYFVGKWKTQALRYQKWVRRYWLYR